MRGLHRRGRRGAAEESKALEERVRRDLELRGVGPSVSRPVAASIAPRAAALSGDAYGAFLDGVAAVQAPARDPRAEAGAVEIQRLVHDFAIELKKLDEGLRLLSSYLLRIRNRAATDHPRIVH